MDYGTIEAEALQTAKERGYKLNPWTLHGRELNRLHDELSGVLSWGQWERWNDLVRATSSKSYRDYFTLALKVSKSAKVRAIATEGLKLVERCEALAMSTCIDCGANFKSANPEYELCDCCRNRD